MRLQTLGRADLCEDEELVDAKDGVRKRRGSEGLCECEAQEQCRAMGPSSSVDKFPLAWISDPLALGTYSRRAVYCFQP